MNCGQIQCNIENFNFLSESVVCKITNSRFQQFMLPLFKGKGAKANNIDNYRGITSFSTGWKSFAIDNEYFSELQFIFREGVGRIEASFTILETINHMLKQGSKVFSCFLDVSKAFDTVWINGLLFQLFSELGIKGRMWLAIKDLYTNVKAKVLYAGSLSSIFRRA